MVSRLGPAALSAAVDRSAPAGAKRGQDPTGDKALCEPLVPANIRRSPSPPVARTALRSIGSKADVVRGDICADNTTPMLAFDSLDERVTRALGMVLLDPMRPLYCRELCRSVGLSAVHFRRLFRQQTGFRLVSFLRALRMERARELVTGTSRTVKEIAGVVGYADPSHFLRAYQRRYGLSPTQARRATSSR